MCFIPFIIYILRKFSFSCSHCFSRIAFAVGGSHSTSSPSLDDKSILQRSSTLLCTAVPMALAMPAFRGKRCRESQNLRGHEEKLFQEDGDNWCPLSSYDHCFIVMCSAPLKPRAVQPYSAQALTPPMSGPSPWETCRESKFQMEPSQRER